MTAPTLAADARNRTLRTALQGLIAATVAGVFPVLQTAVAAGVDKVNWSTLGTSCETAAITAALAYAWRRWLDPSRIPSARPPTDPPGV